MSFSERFKRGVGAVARFVRGLARDAAGEPRSADVVTSEIATRSVLPTDPAELAHESAVLATLARCTMCGACDAAFPYHNVARPAFRGPSDAIAYGRALAEHGALVEFVKNLRRGDLEKLERVCPVSIPFVALADVLERRAERLAPAEPPARKERHRPPHDPG